MIWLVDQEPAAARQDGCRSNSELARRRTHMLPVKARRLAVRAASCMCMLYRVANVWYVEAAVRFEVRLRFVCPSGSAHVISITVKC